MADDLDVLAARLDDGAQDVAADAAEPLIATRTDMTSGPFGRAKWLSAKTATAPG